MLDSSSVNVSQDPSSFTPRKEFLRTPHHTTAHTFSLLAISGANLVRLYAFSPALITALRTHLLPIGFREDAAQNLCELALPGKPWASGKSVQSERLLVEVLGIIYGFGHTYLSGLDYGREQDDRLVMAFQKSSGVHSSSRGSLSRAASPSEGQAVEEQVGTKRIPFALSFLSSSLMRVICPPLHSTPAILAAVRGSWPRGVVSEKKVSNVAFEFKLKGYRCTFPSPCYVKLICADVQQGSKKIHSRQTH